MWESPSVEQLKNEDRESHTAHLKAGFSFQPLFLHMEMRVQAQAQAEQGAHVTQEAGKGCCVQVNPLGPHAPLLGFLEGPQQVHSHCFEQEVEAHREGGQEERSVEISFHAGVIDPSLLGDKLCNKNTLSKKKNQIAQS